MSCALRETVTLNDEIKIQHKETLGIRDIPNNSSAKKTDQLVRHQFARENDNAIPELRKTPAEHNLVQPHDINKLAKNPFNLEAAIGSSQKVQDFESEPLGMGAGHSQKVKAAPIPSDYGSKDCAL